MKRIDRVNSKNANYEIAPIIFLFNEFDCCSNNRRT